MKHPRRMMIRPLLPRQPRHALFWLLWLIAGKVCAAAVDPPVPPKLTGEPIAYVGRAWSGSIELPDPTAEIVQTVLPREMVWKDGRLHWTPNSEQIGPQKIQVTIKREGVQHAVSLDLPVAYPSVVLPDQPSEMLFTPNGGLALLTNGKPANGDHLLPHRHDRNRRAWPTQTTLALVDLRADKVLAVKKLNTAVVCGPLTNDYVALLREEASTRCVLLKTKDLETLQTLTAESPIRNVYVGGKFLVLGTNTAMEIYDAGTLQLLKRLPVRNEYREELTLKATDLGLTFLGIDFEHDFKPRLIAARSFPISTLKVLDEKRDNDFEMAHHADRFGRNVDRRLFRPRTEDRELAGATAIESDGVIVDAMLLLQESRSPRPQEIIEVELKLQVRGSAEGEQLLWRMKQARNSLVEDDRVMLATAAHEAFVAYDSRLYRWPIPRAAASEAAPAAPAAALEFVPRQSALAVTGTGKTTLRHEVRHGTPPYRFSLPNQRAGMTIDETTGDITLDEKLLAREALAELERDLGQGDFETMKTNFEQWDENAQRFAADWLGVKLAGHPFAIPIPIAVQDARGQTSRLDYFVLAALAPADLAAKYQIFPAEQKARRAAEEAQYRRRAAEESSPVARYLFQRLDGLEERLDTNDGLVNRAFELLKNKNAPKTP